jgi:hypothetical protein
MVYIGCSSPDQSLFCTLEYQFIDTFFIIIFPITIIFVLSVIGMFGYSFILGIKKKDYQLLILSFLMLIIITPMLFLGLIWDFNLFMNNEF